MPKCAEAAPAPVAVAPAHDVVCYLNEPAAIE
jgi:hypothetical protein